MTIELQDISPVASTQKTQYADFEDPRCANQIDFDGTSQEEILGFESVWQCQHYEDGSKKTNVPGPFEIKK